MTTDDSTTQRHLLPGDRERFVTDAGLETELVFVDGRELPHLICATLVDEPEGRARLERYYRSFIRLAEDHHLGVLLETPTWRISREWAERIGVDRDGRRRINERSVEMLATLRRRSRLERDSFVISGNLGPRYDGYFVKHRVGADESAEYHREQVADLKAAGADTVSALTLTTAEEAIGIARAANAEGIPAVISFTVETDGHLPSGDTLESAVERVDSEATVAYFGVNCAHPTHFLPTLRRGGSWTTRLKAVRANASKMSHAELDACTELDDGDPVELSDHYRELFAILPSLQVFGGCCGTDARHVAMMCKSLARDCEDSPRVKELAHSTGH